MYVEHGGYLDAVDADALFALAERRDLLVRMETPISLHRANGSHPCGRPPRWTTMSRPASGMLFVLGHSQRRCSKT
ncbi:MAG: hypothetical protein U0531_18830 [Dehalococcoidia bacterium]